MNEFSQSNLGEEKKIENTVNSETYSSGFESELLKKYGNILSLEVNGMIPNKNVFLYVKYFLMAPKVINALHIYPSKTIFFRKIIDYFDEGFPEFCFGLLEIELMKRFLLEKQIKDKRFYIIGYRKIKSINIESRKPLNQIEIYYIGFYQSPIYFFNTVFAEETISIASINEVFNIISDHLDDLTGNYHLYSNSKYGCFITKECKNEESEDINLTISCELEYTIDQIKSMFYTTFKEVNILILKNEIEKKELSWITVCLGRLSYSINDFEGAFNEFTKALSLRSLLYGEVHQDIADSMENIGNVKYVMKKYEESLNLFRQVYDIRQKCLPEDDIRISDSLYNIGVTYLKLKNYNIAREFLEKCLGFLERIKKKNINITFIELKIANCLQGLAYVLDGNKDGKKLIDQDLLALKINLSYYEYENAKIAFLTERISHVYKNLKEEVRAFEYGVKTYKSFVKLYGKDKKTEDSLNFLRDLKSYKKIKRLIFIIYNVRSQVKKVFKRKLIIEEILLKFI